MNFTAKDVAELREITGAGMMDCKKALVHTDGDKEKAIEYLREIGVNIAAKKASRIASEGLIGGYTDDQDRAFSPNSTARRTSSRIPTGSATSLRRRRKRSRTATPRTRKHGSAAKWTE